MKKSISLSDNDVRDILNYIDTTIVYLENCKLRFKILDLSFYFKEIDKGISRCFTLKDKFSKLYSKFNILDLVEKDDDIFDTFLKLN